MLRFKGVLDMKSSAPFFGCKYVNFSTCSQNSLDNFGCKWYFLHICSQKGQAKEVIYGTDYR